MIGPREAALRAMREARVTKSAPPRATVTEMAKVISVTRGRPKKADALSNSDRQRAFRARKKASHGA
jgi:hypothetical protein